MAKAGKRPAKEAVGTLAPMVVGTANFLAVSSLGAECGFSEIELKLLIPSVQRTLERMPASAAQKGAVIIDPLIIVAVLMFWGKRVATIQDQKAKEKYNIEPMEAARANGAAGTTFSVSPDANKQENPSDGVPAGYSPSYIPEQIRSSFESDRI